MTHRYVLIDAVGEGEVKFRPTDAVEGLEGYVVASFPRRKDGRPIGPIGWLRSGWWAHRKQWKARGNT